MNALIYLATQTPVITGEDLERLDLLRRYARECQYTVTEVWPVCDPFNAPGEPAQRKWARQALKDVRFDAIVYWNASENTPDYTCREHLGSTPPAPAGGFQPGARVRYDDATGEVLERIYAGRRNAYDCQVRFDEGGVGTVWESDLTPE